MAPGNASERQRRGRWLDGSFKQPIVATLSVVFHAQHEVVRDPEEGRSVSGTPGAREAGKGLPEPEAAVVSETLRYGDARRPALEMPSIRLAGR